MRVSDRERTPAQGVVYLVDDAEGMTGPGGEPFWGHWESRDVPPRLVEVGAWQTASEAVLWGRQRAAIVLIRVGNPPRYYSAGIEDPAGEQIPRWEDPAEAVDVH